VSDIAEQNTSVAKADTQANGLFQVLERAATNPEVDVEKMERIYQMVEREQDRQAERDFNASLVEAQADSQPVYKAKWNPQTSSWYADIAAVTDGVNNVFNPYGFSLSFSEGETQKPDHIRVICDIRHRGGHSEQRHIDMPVVTTGIKGNQMMTATHGTASAFTYGRRYLIVLIANLPTPDNDGNQPQQSKEANAASADYDSPVIKQLQACGSKEDLQECWKALKPSERNSVPAEVFRSEKQRVGWK
jgi:hypothetical protein